VRIIVITGSTRGIGFALAQAFLESGCAVIVSGRTAAAVEKAVTALAARFGSEGLLGQPCDVTNYAQVQALWEAAHARFGEVDIWINNAGIAPGMANTWEYPPDAIRSVIETNLVGFVWLQSDPARHAGAGSGAFISQALAAMAATTRHGAVRTTSTASYVNRALLKEHSTFRSSGKPVLVGASPWHGSHRFDH
jgi:NAD(P)-dependent dehydrogenase (short-subunit alcohol dehydrogenase family)